MNIEALQQSWGRVGAVGPEAVEYFYAHLFQAHPEVRGMFADDLSPQRERFLAGLGRIVTNVQTLGDDPSFVQQLGRQHARLGVIADHYPVAGASLLATLEHFLGEEWTPELAATWTAAYGAVVELMLSAEEENAA
ncbi:globin domain-containing protein [Nocardia acidivorans]|uniref:globin domain-containing protein n=1 Tax=Nocardia acidivorans TaxID=404580 RepID=UPI00082CC864|nr:globin domain-containing protein [Nocardia acidivorans]